MRIIHLAATVLLSLSSITAAHAETIRVAHDQRFPPFAEVKDGKSTGLAVDILNAAAQRAGLTITYVPVPFAEIQKHSKTAAPMRCFRWRSIRSGGRCSTSRPRW
jgi:polar amino acid transport system substrate-binding protein